MLALAGQARLWNGSSKQSGLSGAGAATHDQLLGLLLPAALGQERNLCRVSLVQAVSRLASLKLRPHEREKLDPRINCQSCGATDRMSSCSSASLRLPRSLPRPLRTCLHTCNCCDSIHTRRLMSNRSSRRQGTRGCCNGSIFESTYRSLVIGVVYGMGMTTKGTSRTRTSSCRPVSQPAARDAHERLPRVHASKPSKTW